VEKAINVSAVKESKVGYKDTIESEEQEFQQKN
jgi:hypothetical protein